jgi:exonuclease SbcD
MRDFRFLHAADIHLDSPLVGLSRYEGLPADRLRRATRDAFDNLVESALREKVDFVVIAGDLFDGEWRDMSTGLYFARAMGRLSEAAIPVFLLKGNHDAESAVTKSLPLPESVKVFSSRKAETFDWPDLGVALHGRSFPTVHVQEDLTESYPPPVAGRFNIGVLHTAVGGYAQHEPYAPCTVQGLVSKGYDYWALGHVHEREVLSQEPWIVFPGNLQGRHARETGAKGATLVEVIDGRVSAAQHLALDALRWLRVVVDCDGATTIDEVHARIRDALAITRVEQADESPAVARVVLVGRTALAATLSDRRALLRDEVRALAQASDELWIEKVILETVPPAIDAAGALEDVASLLDEALGDPELVELLATDLKPFLDAAPPDTCEAGGLHQAAREKRWSDLLAAASIALRERLNAGAA